MYDILMRVIHKLLPQQENDLKKNQISYMQKDFSAEISPQLGFSHETSLVTKHNIVNDTEGLQVEDKTSALSTPASSPSAISSRSPSPLQITNKNRNGFSPRVKQPSPAGDSLAKGLGYVSSIQQVGRTGNSNGAIRTKSKSFSNFTSTSANTHNASYNVSSNQQMGSFSHRQRQRLKIQPALRLDFP